MKKFLWFLVCFKVFGAPLNTPSSTQVSIADHFASFFVSLENPKVQGFYGTGWITGIDETETKIFVTLPAHLLPIPRRAFDILVRWDALQLASVKLELIAEDPGNDLAFGSFSIENRNEKDRSQASAIVKKALKSYFLPAEVSDSVSTALIGVPANWDHFDSNRPKIAFQGGQDLSPSKKESTSPKNSAWNIPYYTSNVAITRSDFSKRTEARKMNVCPPIFLNDCYEITQQTGGFSGGAVLINQNHAGQPWGVDHVRILGMVTHFSPLTPFSYIIPVQKIVELSQRINQKKQKTEGYYIETHESDLNPYFEYVSEDEIVVLRGALKGNRVKRRGQNFNPGGWDSSKGGWDSSKGGWDSSKGGGGNRIGNFQVDVFFNVAGVINRRELEFALTQPEKWILASQPVSGLIDVLLPLKGLKNSLGFNPGVQVEQETVFSWGNQSVNDLSDFIQAYLKNPNLGLITGSDVVPLPQKFIGIPNDKVSSVTVISGYQFKDSLALVEKAKADPRSIMLSELEGRLLAEQMKAKKMGKPTANVFAFRSEDQTTSPVQPFNVVIENGMLHINFGQTYEDGSVVLDTLGSVQIPFQFKSLGNGTYRYVGSLGDDGYGVAMLQYQVDEDVWDLKLLRSSKSSFGTEVGKVFNGESFNLDAFYFRFKTADVGP